jgi:proteic killer suppression protein
VTRSGRRRNLIGCTSVTNWVTLQKNMIKGFRHKGLAEFFKTGSARKIQAKHAKRLRMILTMLNVATRPGQMDAPGLRLHPLKGRLQGWFAVSVDENFRVTFRFEEGNVVEVDYDDYH